MYSFGFEAVPWFPLSDSDLAVALGTNNFTMERALVDDFSRADLAGSLVRDGYAFLKSWHPAISSDRVAQSCGRQLRFGRAEAVHRLVPKASAGLNHYSGIFGLGAFPFHTDMAHWREPPRYMMLRCVKGYERGVVEKHYSEGKYGKIVKECLGGKSERIFRHEIATASLVIRNLITGRDEIIKKTVAGYDAPLQEKSFEKLLQVFDGLMRWEEEHGK